MEVSNLRCFGASLIGLVGNMSFTVSALLGALGLVGAPLSSISGGLVLGKE